MKEFSLSHLHDNQDGGIVVPVVLWWLGVPLALLLVLWMFGVF